MLFLLCVSDLRFSRTYLFPLSSEDTEKSTSESGEMVTQHGRVILILLATTAVSHAVPAADTLASSSCAASDYYIVTAATIDNQGTTTYTVAPTVVFSLPGAGGSAATGTATLSSVPGKVISINIGSAGSGYTSAPTITFTGGTTSVVGTVAQASVALSCCKAGYAYVRVGGIDKFGRHIAEDDCVACVPGKYKNQAGNLDCIPIGATVSSVCGVSISAGGSGYTSAPTVQFSGGEGSGASGTATVSNGAVTSVTMTAAGSGYTSAPKIFFTGGGNFASGALASAAQFCCNAGYAYDAIHVTCVACEAGKYKNQVGNSGCIPTGATVSSVCGVSISAGGSGYTSTPTVQFSGGGGSGASGTATVSNGSVTSVTMTAAGSGYTSVPTISFTGGGGTGALASAAQFCCNAGYGFVRADGHYVDDCVACVPGKYKNQVGNSGCTDCPANTYSPTTALISVKDCKTCGNFKVSPSGSIAENACICAAGYGLKSGTNDCSACQAGTYKDTEGNSNCINCWSGSYGETLAATTVDSCKTCGRGSYSASGSIKESDCVCDSDFRHLNNGSTWTCAMHLTILIMVVFSFLLILIACCIVSYRPRSPSPPIKDTYQPVPQPVLRQKDYRTVWSQTPPERLTTPIPMPPPEYSVSVKPRVEYVDTVEMVPVAMGLTPQPVRMVPVHPVQYEQPPALRQFGCVAVCLCFCVRECACVRACVCLCILFVCVSEREGVCVFPSVCACVSTCVQS